MKTSVLIMTILFSAAIFVGCKNSESEKEVTEIDEIGTEETGMDEVANDNGFSEFDIDNDERWDENEFRESYQANFTTWDTDQDGSLGEDEFYKTTYSKIDKDTDGQLSKEEFQEAKDMFSAHVDDKNFESFDADGNGSLNQEEWRQALGDSEWFKTYDANSDGSIGSDEWRDGTFQDWDRDEDNYLNEDEFNNAYNGVW